MATKTLNATKPSSIGTFSWRFPANPAYRRAGSKSMNIAIMIGRMSSKSRRAPFVLAKVLATVATHQHALK